MSCKTRKVRITLMVEPRHLEALDRMADDNKESKSAIVRKMIDHCILELEKFTAYCDEKNFGWVAT